MHDKPEHLSQFASTTEHVHESEMKADEGEQLGRDVRIESFVQAIGHERPDVDAADCAEGEVDVERHNNRPDEVERAVLVGDEAGQTQHAHLHAAHALVERRGLLHSFALFRN